MIARVKCIECDNMILPQTAEDNDGLCAPCAKISPESRAAISKFQKQLEDGSYYRLSEAEVHSASVPKILTNGDHWKLQPEYYADENECTPLDVLNRAIDGNKGNIFLVTDEGHQLNVGFSQKYAVCEYQNESLGEFRIAYSDQNLTQQVDETLHVAQACPCCGVSMLWYPSRYHMPKDLAFQIVRDTIERTQTPNVRWIETDDYTYTFRGRG
jgi:hypothetical protein